ncbi:glycosyltransferase [Candidatus Ventrimonas sp. KK005]|jgi:Glycosyltransferases, probably involved in cell wall biogenesis|nr:glycosyltransferase [Clostridiaceae bacterium]
MNQNYSVLMSVYKKEKPEYLQMAIESMLKQTIPPNDFVLVCDGPLTRELDSVILTVRDQYPSLFQVIRLSQNSGLGNALNIGLKACKNELVARMDSDDLSLPYRCELQLNAFKKEPELVFCSGNIAEFTTDDKEILTIRHVPSDYKEILKYAKRRNPMNHMAVMFKKSMVETVGGYIEINLAEDYYLWVRLLKNGYRAANLNKILVKVRIGNGMYKRRGGIKYVKSIYRLEKKFLLLHFISFPEFIINCTIRITSSLMPVSFRKQLYERRLRKYIC